MSKQSASRRVSTTWLLGGLVLALIVVGVVAVVAMLRPDRTTLVLATGGEGGTYLPLGKGMAKVIEEAHPHIQVKVVQSSGAVDNMSRLERGEADLAFVQNDIPGGAKIRTVAPMYREVLHFLARKEAGIESLRDIRGKRVAIGERNSGTEAVVMALLRHYDLQVSDFKPSFISANAATDAVLNGEIDAMLFVGGMKSAACQRAVASGMVDFVGLGTAGVDSGEIEGFRFDYPFAEPYVIPVLTYSSPGGGVPKTPVATIAIRAVLVTRSSIPEDVMRQVTQAIFLGRTELIRAHGSASELRERFDETWLQFPLHPGAQSFYRRDEPGFLVTYAEVMGFVLSMVVFLAAAFAGIREWIRHRKKNRIDVYYTRLDQILTELKDEDIASTRLTELDEELTEMQRRAFRQLVDEQLRADESFRIFQDFLAECKGVIAERRLADA